MPAANRHFEQARANRAHAEYLVRHHANDANALQWAVTAAFYSALHCLQGHLAELRIIPRSHVERDYYLADPRYGVPDHVYQAYSRLKQRSVGARYLLRRFTVTDVQKLLDTDLAAVTAFVKL